MSYFQRLIAVLTALIASGALADPSSRAPQTEGSATVALTSLGPDPALAALDLTFTLPISRHRPLELELGVYQFVLRDKRPHETYAALRRGEHWRFGVVRPAYDAVLPSVFEHAAPRLAYDTLRATRAFTTAEAMSRTAVPLGLSYTARTDSLTWAVSLHDAARGSFESASASVAWDSGAAHLSAALEGVWRRQDNAWIGANAKLGGFVAQGRADFGLALLHPGANRAPDAVEGFVTLHATGALDLGALAHLEHDTAGDIWGLAAAYRLGLHRSARAAVTQRHRDTAVHASFSYSF